MRQAYFVRKRATSKVHVEDVFRNVREGLANSCDDCGSVDVQLHLKTFSTSELEHRFFSLKLSTGSERSLHELGDGIHH